MTLPDRFDDLPVTEQERVRRAGDRMGRLAWGYCASIVIAPPPGSASGKINSASGFVLSVGLRHWLGTAWHVVEKWLERTESGERLLFQVGHADLPPINRAVEKNKAADVAFLEIDESDIPRIGVQPCQPVLGWPPFAPHAGDYLLVAGYPASERLMSADQTLDFGVCAGLLRATTARDGVVHCQFEREHWISSSGVELPPQGADLGGMSGGPVLLVRDLAYPLVGMVAEHSQMFEIMRVSTFSELDLDLS